MNIEIVARNLELDDELRSFVESLLEKSGRFLEPPVAIRLILEAEKHRRVADLHVAHRFGVIQATEETSNVHEAVRLAVEKATKQAKRSRQKFKDRKRRAKKPAFSEWPVEVFATATLRESKEPKAIETLRVKIESMSVDGAAEALEASHLGFQVFRNTSDGRISILYRRDSGHYGLITPES